MGHGGKREGAGRKTKAAELGLQELLDTCWPLSDRQATIKKLASLANRGNLQAVQILMSYTYGKPKERVELSTDKDKPIEIRTFNYAATIAAIAPGSGEDSQASGEDQDHHDGAALG